jgi:hypothetical protein
MDAHILSCLDHTCVFLELSAGLLICSLVKDHIPSLQGDRLIEVGRRIGDQDSSACSALPALALTTMQAQPFGDMSDLSDLTDSETDELSIPSTPSSITDKKLIIKRLPDRQSPIQQVKSLHGIYITAWLAKQLYSTFC